MTARARVIRRTPNTSTRRYSPAIHLARAPRAPQVRPTAQTSSIRPAYRSSQPDARRPHRSRAPSNTTPTRRSPPTSTSTHVHPTGMARRTLQLDAPRPRDQQGSRLYRKRQGMIEPVFADVKFNRKIDRFQRRGRSAARSEWRLAAADHNVLKLHNHRIATVQRPETAPQAAIRPDHRRLRHQHAGRLSRPHTFVRQPPSVTVIGTWRTARPRWGSIRGR